MLRKSAELHDSAASGRIRKMRGIRSGRAESLVRTGAVPYYADDATQRQLQRHSEKRSNKLAGMALGT